MTQPFHLSLVVPDLNRVRAFYVDVLGCRVGREMGSWLDILFFGHQLTIHQDRGAPMTSHRFVDQMLGFCRKLTGADLLRYTPALSISTIG